MFPMIRLLAISLGSLSLVVSLYQVTFTKVLDMADSVRAFMDVMYLNTTGIEHEYFVRSLALIPFHDTVKKYSRKATYGRVFILAHS